MTGPTTRRRSRTPALIGFALAGLCTLMAAPPAAALNVVAQPITDQGVEVELRAVATIADNSYGTAPRLNMMSTTGQRLFVVEERDGKIYELIADGDSFNPVLFFDVASAIESASGQELDRSNLFHGGLRSVAFHPDFASNGLLYVSAMETRPANPSAHHYLSDVANPVAADSVLLEFTATNGTVNPASYREVFRVGMPVYDHPIKQIAFNQTATPADADYGLLYIAHGDGSVLSAIAGGGQNNDALGKILRIDPVENGAQGYRIPADNPFVGDASMIDEAYSIGHRNPHHLAFTDRAGATQLLVAEAGRDNVEEINLIVSGHDYGWPQREGTFVHLADGGVGTGVAALPSDDAANAFTYPAAQYGHTGDSGETVTRQSVAGGYVIDNGSALDGNYFFADFVETGDLFHASLSSLNSAVTRLDANNPATDQPTDLTQAQIGLAGISFDHDNNPATPTLPRANLVDVFNDAPDYETNRADVRFGQGPGGELYIMSKRNNTIYLVTNTVAPEPEPEPEPEPDPDAEVNIGPFREATTLTEILAATDYRADDARLLRLYQAYFAREPDMGGAIFWLDAIRTGTWTLEGATAHFGESTEFVRTYGQVDDDEFVRIAYRNVLDREAEPGGFTYWRGRLDDGLSRADMMLLVSDSPEFRGRHPYAPYDSSAIEVN